MLYNIHILSQICPASSDSEAYLSKKIENVYKNDNGINYNIFIIFTCSVFIRINIKYTCIAYSQL